jgi:hypothetical protein
MCVSVHVCICIHTISCVCMCVHVYVHVCFMCVYVCTHDFMCVYVCTYPWNLMRVSICIYTHTYTLQAGHWISDNLGVHVVIPEYPGMYVYVCICMLMYVCMYV